MNYKNTLVIAPMFYPAGKLPESARWMLESAAMHGIEVMQIGIGERWTNHFDAKVSKVFNQTKDLAGYDHVILADGNDTLFATGLGEIHHRFARIGKDFVCSGETWCWPWQTRYGEINPLAPARLRHPNSGFYMAKWPAYLRIMEALLAQQCDGYSERGRTVRNDDQAAIYRYWMEHRDEIHIDTQAKLCLSVASFDGRWILNHDIEWGKRPFCHATKTCPCVLHFNSGDKWRIKDVWDMLKR